MRPEYCSELFAGASWLSKLKECSMKRKAWWEEEWLNEYQKQETIDWLKENTVALEIAEKEEIIVKAYMYEVSQLKEKIKILQKQIEEKEKECSKCLAKIHTGDSGLMEVLGEKNTRNLIQIQETNAPK